MKAKRMNEAELEKKLTFVFPEFWSSTKSMSDKDKHETAKILLALLIIVFLLLKILPLINRNAP